jgi:hypothetical protein
MSRAKKTGLRIALLTGMTPQMFWGKRGKWRSTGLLRRLIPIHYAYTKKTQHLIHKSIQRGVDTLSYGHTKQARTTRIAVTIPTRIEHNLRL